MGFIDRFRSRPSQQEEASTSSPGPEFLGTDFQPSIQDQAQDFSQLADNSSSESLRNFASSSSSEEGRLYNPYEGLNTAVDPRVLRNVYKLPSQPEFLFSEEASVHKRSWSENLAYYTGTGYLTGAVLGGGRGALEAVKGSPALPAADSTRLRVNRLLNVSGRTGRTAGNALGILGLFFSTSESGLGYLSDGYAPDWLNTVGAGFTTGALYRSTRGPRAAAVAGAVGAAAGGLLLAARNTIARGL